MAKNDPSLWTENGIIAALEETEDEKGVSLEYGWVCLGTVYDPGSRSVDPIQFLADVRERPGVVELWATIRLNEDDARRYLIADARSHLKPGERFELRKKHPTNYGRTFGMAWYRNATMDKRESWGKVPGEPEQANHYLLVGEYTVPDR